jgi:hypothetical protein
MRQAHMFQFQLKFSARADCVEPDALIPFACVHEEKKLTLLLLSLLEMMLLLLLFFVVFRFVLLSECTLEKMNDE